MPSLSNRTGSRGDRLSYQPALDGIRALAVSAVLAYHAGLPWARGGFLGVDAFFVLSGYLITSLLLNEWRTTGRISLTAFWARRARRLLPAVFLVVLAVTGYAAFFAAPGEMYQLRTESLSTVTGIVNWRYAFGQHHLTPLSHTWSLAVEQQWYLVWPLIALAFLRLRRGSPLALLVVALALVAVSASVMAGLYGAGGDRSAAYYGTETRAQSLLVGGALAILLAQHGPVRGKVRGLALQAAALPCVAVVGWAWFAFTVDSAFLYRGGFLLLALAAAVVVAAAVQPKFRPLGSLLSLPPLRALGLISYGVYLWHWPIYFVLTGGRTGLDLYSLFAVRASLTLAVATLSYNLIETPFRRGAFRRWRTSWTMAPAGAMCAAALVAVVALNGMP